MALSIIFTAYTKNGFKNLRCERTFTLCETSFERRQMFKGSKYSGVKVGQIHFKEIIELITSIIRNSLIKRLFNFHAVFSNRRRYV